jgi:hypothetical protein
MATVRPRLVGKRLDQIPLGSLVFLTINPEREPTLGWGIRATARYPNGDIDGIVRLSGDGQHGRFEIFEVADQLLTMVGDFSFVPEFASLRTDGSAPGEMLLRPQGPQLVVGLPVEGGESRGLLDLESCVLSLYRHWPDGTPAVSWKVIDEFQRPIFSWTRPALA